MFYNVSESKNSRSFKHYYVLEEDIIMNKQQIYYMLDNYGCNYFTVEHPAVYTIEDMENCNLPYMEYVAKNLFLRDDKKLHYYLVVMTHDKTADLKKLRELIGSRKLSFASEIDLAIKLDLLKGSVTPFGILNDDDRSVEVIMDNDIMNNEKVGVHPNTNEASVWLSPIDLVKIIEDHGNTIKFIDIPRS